MNKYKLDLHVHSTLSNDGGIDEKDINKIFENNLLDYLAITDHNEIDYALSMAKKFPGKIIVGEEIKSVQGEIVALFIEKKIEKGMTMAATIKEIRRQGGLCYFPHPFATSRHGIGIYNLDVYYDMVDLIEGYNARILLGSANSRALRYALEKKLVYSSNSDAHSIRGIGKVYNLVKESPTRDNLIELLRDADFEMGRSSLEEYLSPTINRIKKRFKKT